ncbi:hypothetical protein EOD04_28405 [Mesorhizobium sp. M2C.T.Ca.TU.009.01.2.1]|nr:hypothetical protein EOD07_15960 [Mesorhizobium sp. M2C.T.Ca.TU.002.02.1.1]RUU59064.1 hypothetical protein EOD04_28405 [Mesorhizobium sp. M2C.T.Ca.TU.009.01.2.1]
MRAVFPCWSPKAQVGAAPHPPFRHLLPANGEKAVTADLAPFLRRLRLAKSLLLPVAIRGEAPGRAMRGGADLT